MSHISGNDKDRRYDDLLTEHQKITYIAQLLYENRVRNNQPGSAETDWAEAERFYMIKQGLVFDEHDALLAQIDPSIITKKKKPAKHANGSWFKHHINHITVAVCMFGVIRFGAPIVTDAVSHMMKSLSSDNIAKQGEFTSKVARERDLQALVDKIGYPEVDTWDRERKRRVLEHTSRIGFPSAGYPNPAGYPDSVHDDRWDRDEISVGLYTTNYQNADLSGRDFEGQNLVFSNFSGANLMRANMKAAHLLSVDMSKANLVAANFSGANLDDANFRGAKAWQADFRDANLSDADFRDADLTGADFRGANLNGADFRGATLKNAIFDVRGLESTAKFGNN